MAVSIITPGNLSSEAPGDSSRAAWNGKMNYLIVGFYLQRFFYFVIRQYIFLFLKTKVIHSLCCGLAIIYLTATTTVIIHPSLILHISPSIIKGDDRKCDFWHMLRDCLMHGISAGAVHRVGFLGQCRRSCQLNACSIIGFID